MGRDVNIATEDNQDSSDYERKTVAEEVVEELLKNPLFHDSMQRPFIDWQNELFPIYSEQFKDKLYSKYWKSTRKLLTRGTLVQIIDNLAAIAKFEGKERKIFTRIAQINDTIIYDFCQQKPVYALVKNGTYKLLKSSNVPFYRPPSMKPQAFPDKKSDATKLLPLLKKYFRLSNESEFLLLACYVLSCFVPNIQHPQVMFHGNKGASKTTAIKLITRIVDPRMGSVSTLPKKLEDLALILSRDYLHGFDNLRYLSREHSDLLCVNCTGGSDIKRKLYSDSELVYTKLS